MTESNRQSISYELWILCLLFVFSSSAQGQDWVYTTIKGDTLWGISQQYLDRDNRYRQLIQLNGIKNPKNLLPGTKIRIPLNWIISNVVSAKIIDLEGKATLTNFIGNTTSIAAGDEVNLGDTLRTAEHSTLAIQFADHSVLTLHANSIVKFDHLSAHGTTGMVDTRLRLVRGRMDTQVIPASGPGSRFEIKTPSAISAVRGTDYRASILDHGESSTIEVLDGNVAVKANEAKELVKMGFGTRVEKGKPPLTPRQLLPAPLFQPVPASIRKTGYTLYWDHIAEAKSYRVEISKSQAFSTIVWEAVTEQPKFALPDLDDGNYFFRTRAIDQLDLEGLNATTSFHLDTQPQPPLPLQPADQAVFRGSPPELQWTDSDQAASYHLEIARTASFDKPVVNETSLTQTHYSDANLTDPDTYYWRVTSVDAAGKTGPEGVSRQFEIKPAAMAVDARIARQDDGQLVATWSKGHANQNYQVQIAMDKNFTDLQLDQITATPRFAFAPVIWQNRYLRVRIVEADGYTGPWGARQKIAGEKDDSWLLLVVPLFLGIL